MGKLPVEVVAAYHLHVWNFVRRAVGQLWQVVHGAPAWAAAALLDGRAVASVGVVAVADT